MTETSPPRAQRILLVDDEPFVCEAVKLLLTTDGHSVETARNGAEALAKYDPAKFDLVITDFRMEGMQGDELAAEIKQLAPGKPIILLTAYPPEVQPAAVDLVMTKPFYFESLRAGLAQVLGLESARSPES